MRQRVGFNVESAVRSAINASPAAAIAQAVRTNARSRQDVRWVATLRELVFVHEAAAQGALVYVEEKHAIFQLQFVEPPATTRSFPAQVPGGWWIEVTRTEPTD